MITYNELRITPDKKHLIVDVQIDEDEYYLNVYLDSIVIDTQRTFNTTGPSNNPIFTLDCNSQKRFRGLVDIDSIADNLFFVYAIATGQPSENAPCGMSDSIILGVVYDKYPMYLLGMNYIREMQGCSAPSNFIDYILLLKAFELSLQTGNYNLAIKYWEEFFHTKGTQVKSKCGCYGRV